MSKAFGPVLKEWLLLKLLQNGFCDKMYLWPRYYLFQLTTRVTLAGLLSYQVKVSYGVPHDCVFPTTLFVVYINDLLTALPKHVAPRMLKTMMPGDQNQAQPLQHT